MLASSRVYKHLESKFSLFGFDIIDIVVPIICATILNVLFGRTSYGPLLVFTVPLFIGGTLYFTKRGKPEEYLQHCYQFSQLPGCFYAGEVTSDQNKWRKIYEVKR